MKREKKEEKDREDYLKYKRKRSMHLILILSGILVLHEFFTRDIWIESLEARASDISSFNYLKKGAINPEFELRISLMNEGNSKAFSDAGKLENFLPPDIP